MTHTNLIQFPDPPEGEAPGQEFHEPATVLDMGEARIQKLEARIQKLEKRIAELERENERLRELCRRHGINPDGPQEVEMPNAAGGTVDPLGEEN